jgi:hypothetical protein
MKLSPAKLDWNSPDRGAPIKLGGKISGRGILILPMPDALGGDTPVPSRCSRLQFSVVCEAVQPLDFQVTVLKVLVSYPDGFACLDDLKRDVAILATSGKDWSERTKRLAAQIPNLAIFSQGLVERLEGGWRITQQGRDALAFMEAPTPALNR